MVRADLTDAARASLTAVLEASSQPLVAIKLPEATILDLNPPAESLFGESASALRGRPASGLFHGTDEVHASVAISALATGAIDSYTSRRRMRTRNGTEAWALVRAFDLDGSTIGIGMVACGDEPRPLDPLEKELEAAIGTVWPSPPRQASDPDRARRGSGRQAIAATLDSLPMRQREIVAALMQGKRTGAIARELYVSKSTVRSHLSSIFKSFGVHSQGELIELLRSPGLAAGDAAND